MVSIIMVFTRASIHFVLLRNNALLEQAKFVFINTCAHFRTKVYVNS